MTDSAFLRAASGWTLGALALVLAWDASGLDLALARLAGDAAGFAWRGDGWLYQALHEGPRLAGWALLAGLFAAIRWPVGALRRLPAGERAWLAGSVLLALLAVSLVKRVSATSCPWDLREFGGNALYVSHWVFGSVDGGGGHCFPAGHASTGFAWVAGWFALRERAPPAARVWLALALGIGLLLGLVQQLRGAHYMSHTLWTAWICWTVALAMDAARRALGQLSLHWEGRRHGQV